MIDLHTHSNKSDGSMNPADLVDYAVKKRLSAIALTDHDTIDGLDEALSRAKELSELRKASGGKDGADIEVIPGIEFSTEYEKKDVHILGLYIDYNVPAFRERLRRFVDSRINRNIKMCDKLREEAGMDITWEKLQEEFPDAVITRAHYARYMLSHGYIKTLSEAFERYIGDDCKYFIPREKVTPVQAVKLILDVGGIPILAHPTLYHLGEEKLDKLTSELKNAGLAGIEAIYSTYDAQDEQQIRRLAEKYDLCISGGSDFHGACKPGLELGTGYGKLYVPEEILVNLKKDCADEK